MYHHKVNGLLPSVTVVCEKGKLSPPFCSPGYTRIPRGKGKKFRNFFANVLFSICTKGCSFHSIVKYECLWHGNSKCEAHKWKKGRSLASISYTGSFFHKRKVHPPTNTWLNYILVCDMPHFCRPRMLETWYLPSASNLTATPMVAGERY